MASTDNTPSSDEAMTGAPLRHARVFQSKSPFKLKSGHVLDGLEICYETYGELSDTRDNAVLICHAVSGDSHVARHNDEDQPGWWDILVGPGLALDTDRYFVICSNVIGGCRGSTGPNFKNPATDKPYGADFPQVSVEDMVDAQALLIEYLGIDKLLAVVGGSLGGFQTLVWATRHPDKTRAAIPIATSPRLTMQSLAFDVVGRNAITQDPDFAEGQYYPSAGPQKGLAIARMLAHITYLTSESMDERFDRSRLEPHDIDTEFEKRFSVGSYLAHQGDKFVSRFDANSYITLSTAMDLFDLGRDIDTLRISLRPSQCEWLLIAFSSDWLYPPKQSRDIVDALLAEGKPVSFCVVPSDCGHDAFLLRDDLHVYGTLLSGFLRNLYGEGRHEDSARKPVEPAQTIFQGQTLDHRVLAGLIPDGKSVLDLGCGNGELLYELKSRNNHPTVGVDINVESVLECVARGVHIVHADLDQGLASFGDAQFDVAVLSQTLQAIEPVADFLRELVRVADSAIVSFPNFAFRDLREMFYREGVIPKAEGPYGYEWHNSPNRRFPSIRDFEELAATESIEIQQAFYLDTAGQREAKNDPNLNADIAIYVLSKKETKP